MLSDCIEKIHIKFSKNDIIVSGGDLYVFGEILTPEEYEELINENDESEVIK